VVNLGGCSVGFGVGFGVVIGIDISIGVVIGGEVEVEVELQKIRARRLMYSARADNSYDTLKTGRH